MNLIRELGVTFSQPHEPSPFALRCIRSPAMSGGRMGECELFRGAEHVTGAQWNSTGLPSSWIRNCDIPLY